MSKTKGDLASLPAIELKSQKMNALGVFIFTITAQNYLPLAPARPKSETPPQCADHPPKCADWVAPAGRGFARSQGGTLPSAPGHGSGCGGDCPRNPTSGQSPCERFRAGVHWPPVTPAGRGCARSQGGAGECPAVGFQPWQRLAVPKGVHWPTGRAQGPPYNSGGWRYRGPISQKTQPRHTNWPRLDLIKNEWLICVNI
jgi:hypothetical protein